MENVNKALDEVIECITKSSDYQNCISYQKQMESNEEIMRLVNQIKKTQKKYIRSQYDSKIKEELDSLEEQLMDIPLYHMYADSLENVNLMIDMVKGRINDYFDQLLNEKKN